MKLAVVIVLLLHCPAHWGRAVPEDEESVVSIYTTQPTTSTSGTGSSGARLDVYHQIANNIAERITSPIYRFLGIGKNKTEDGKTTKRPWDKIELLDELPEEVTKANFEPVDNNIDNRDVEELSVEALKKSDQKPEKITLFNSYLPTNEKIERNDTVNEIDDDLDFNDDDDDDNDKPREGGVVYVLELIGSFFQLAWGALLALFKPSNSS